MQEIHSKKRGKETFQKAKQNKRRRQDKKKKKMKGKQEHEKKYLRESLESPSRSADRGRCNRVSNMTERVLTSRTNWDKSRRERINEIFGNYILFLSSISINKGDIRTK